MANILPFDELNAFADNLRARFGDGSLTENAAGEEEDIIDEMLDLYLLAYANANNITNDALSSDWAPPLDDVMRVVDKEVAGKTWRQRVEGYFASGGTVDDLLRIAETEAHRIANASAFETAKAAGATEKTWHCMMLPTSRDDHIWLDGVSAPIDGVFYNENGDTTRYPGEWGIPEQDINCLCWLTFR